MKLLLTLITISILAAGVSQAEAYVTLKEQLLSGVPPIDVICSPNLEIIVKKSNDMPACVSSTTAVKLIERNWGSSYLSSYSEYTQSDTYSYPHEDMKKIIDEMDAEIISYLDDIKNNPDELEERTSQFTEMFFWYRANWDHYEEYGEVQNTELESRVSDQLDLIFENVEPQGIYPPLPPNISPDFGNYMEILKTSIENEN